MTSIASTYSGQYYQLPAQAGQTTTPPATASTDSLAQILAATGSPADNSAYLLDLSPQAQDYLNQSGSGDAADFSSGSASFVLTNTQQQQIGAILAKYKDAPQTQDTYNQIQNDLQAAGLSPQQLAQKDSINSFNPTTVFIDALNGKTDDIPSAGSSAEQTKSTNYMQQIYKQWQTIASVSSATADGGPAPAS